MRCWIFFHADPYSDVPGAYAVRQFMENAARMEIDLAVLQPQKFDLVGPVRRQVTGQTRLHHFAHGF